MFIPLSTHYSIYLPFPIFIMVYVYLLSHSFIPFLLPIYLLSLLVSPSTVVRFSIFSAFCFFQEILKWTGKEYFICHALCIDSWHTKLMCVRDGLSCSVCIHERIFPLWHGLFDPRHRLCDPIRSAPSVHRGIRYALPASPRQRRSLSRGLRIREDRCWVLRLYVPGPTYFILNVVIICFFTEVSKWDLRLILASGGTDVVFGCGEFSPDIATWMQYVDLQLAAWYETAQSVSVALQGGITLSSSAAFGQDRSLIFILFIFILFDNEFAYILVYSPAFFFSRKDGEIFPRNLVSSKKNLYTGISVAWLITSFFLYFETVLQFNQ